MSLNLTGVIPKGRDRCLKTRAAKKLRNPRRPRNNTMPTAKKRVNFFESEEGLEIERTLRGMALDAAYNTDASYSANSSLYPDNLIPFVAKHMSYLNAHPSTDPQHYISNLRLMTKVR